MTFWNGDRVSRYLPLLWISALSLALFAASDAFANDANERRLKIELPIATQGPLWPPSEVFDADGNFVVIGKILTQVAPGRIIPIAGQAAIVSKDTVPPLDSMGREDFRNQLGAAYDVVRPLDLSRGSPDLDMVLYTASYGPPEGSFGGGARIPMEDDSAYNLNSGGNPCPELFPSESQRFLYKRPSLPIHLAPIWGFQDGLVGYDVDTGDAFVPNPGERMVDFRREEPITLGEYIAARGSLDITLERYEPAVGGFTWARFDFRFRKLLPNSVYTIWAIRAHLFMPPRDGARGRPDPLNVPNVFVTDDRGRARVSYDVRHPFADPATDVDGTRILGIAVDLHSDFQNWGSCFARLGVGVDIHTHLNTRPAGINDLTNFVTMAPPE